MNRQIWQYGAWVRTRPAPMSLPVLDPLPFASGTVRARAVSAEAQRQFRSGYEPRLMDLLDLAQLDRLAE